MGEQRILKSNFLMKISHFAEQEEGLKETSSEIVRVKAKDFEKSLYEGRATGTEYTIHVVNKVPENIQFDAIYIRADGKFVWVFKKD